MTEHEISALLSSRTITVEDKGDHWLSTLKRPWGALETPKMPPVETAEQMMRLARITFAQMLNDKLRYRRRAGLP